VARAANLRRNRAFKKELHKFEHDLPYDPNVIQARFVQMIRGVHLRSLPSRPVYVTNEIEAEFTSGLQRCAGGVAFRLYSERCFIIRDSGVQIQAFERRGRLEDALKGL